MIINAVPRESPLSADYFPAAVVAMRLAGAKILATEKIWDVMRDYCESDWPSVLTDLKRDERLRTRWF